MCINFIFVEDEEEKKTSASSPPLLYSSCSGYSLRTLLYTHNRVIYGIFFMSLRVRLYM